MTKLLYFTRIQEMRREGVSLYFGMKEMIGLYTNGGENMNGMTFNES